MHAPTLPQRLGSESWTLTAKILNFKHLTFCSISGFQFKSKIQNTISNLKGGGESKVALGGVEGAESGRAANYEVSGGGGEGSGAGVEGVHLEAELDVAAPRAHHGARGGGAHLNQREEVCVRIVTSRPP